MIDPGVLIAALLSPTGAPGLIFRRWLQGEIEIVTSPQLLAELKRVLERPKFRPYVSTADARDFISLLRRGTVPGEDHSPTAPLSLDPGDDYLIGLARAVGVRFLVSGDRHLLDAKLADPTVLTPRQLIDLLDHLEASRP